MDLFSGGSTESLTALKPLFTDGDDSEIFQQLRGIEEGDSIKIRTEKNPEELSLVVSSKKGEKIFFDTRYEGEKRRGYIDIEILHSESIFLFFIDGGVIQKQDITSFSLLPKIQYGDDLPHLYLDSIQPGDKIRLNAHDAIHILLALDQKESLKPPFLWTNNTGTSSSEGEVVYIEENTIELNSNVSVFNHQIVAIIKDIIEIRVDKAEELFINHNTPADSNKVFIPLPSWYKKYQYKPRRVMMPVPPEKVYRSSDIVSIGNFYGSSYVFQKSLEKSGVISPSGQWVRGNKEVIIHGNIFGPANMQGIDIILFLHHLRSQAKDQGGNIIFLAGKYDIYFISFLLGVDFPHNLRSVFIKSLKTHFDLNEENFLVDDFLKSLHHHEKGKILLNEVCNMRIAEQIDDTLFLSAVYRNDTLAFILENSVSAINNVFQSEMEICLLRFKSSKNINQGFLSLFSLFDDPHQENISFENAIPELKNNGINTVFYSGRKDHQFPHFFSYSGIRFHECGENDIEGVPCSFGIIRQDGEQENALFFQYPNESKSDFLRRTADYFQLEKRISQTKDLTVLKNLLESYPLRGILSEDGVFYEVRVLIKIISEYFKGKKEIFALPFIYSIRSCVNKMALSSLNIGDIVLWNNTRFTIVSEQLEYFVFQDSSEKEVHLLKSDIYRQDILCILKKVN